MLVCSALRIKPLQCIGLSVEKLDICRYWLGLIKSDTAEYQRQNVDFILDLHKSKIRFRNQHLLLACFTSHYENWLKFELNKNNNKPKCSVCGSALTRNCLFLTGICCNLKLTGRVPIKSINKPEHLEFLRCLNKLVVHPMFATWTAKDKP